MFSTPPKRSRAAARMVSRFKLIAGTLPRLETIFPWGIHLLRLRRGNNPRLDRKNLIRPLWPPSFTEAMQQGLVPAFLSSSPRSLDTCERGNHLGFSRLRSRHRPDHGKSPGPKGIEGATNRPPTPPCKWLFGESRQRRAAVRLPHISWFCDGLTVSPVHLLAGFRGANLGRVIR